MDLDDVFKYLFKLVWSVIRAILEVLLEWFFESGIRRLPQKPSQIGEWWRRDTLLQKLHSVIVLVLLGFSAVLMVVVIAAVFGAGPLATG